MSSGESPPLAIDLGSSFDAFRHAADVFFSNVAAIDPAPLGVALLFYLGMLLARTRAWQNVLRAAYPERKVAYSKITASYLAGAGLNSFIPARVGDAVKIFLVKRSIRGSSYPAITSSFLVQSVFDTSVGVLVLIYAITQGLLPGPPELPELPAFELSFWAENPEFLLFFLTALGIAAVAAFALLARRVEEFWDRVKQGVVILTDPLRYLRQVASWQGVAWLARFGSFWFFLDAFHIGGSLSNVLLVMSVHSVATLLPFTPGGAGAQQALLVATLTGSPGAVVLSYSVGQQLAIAAWAALLGFLAIAFVFRTTDWRSLIRSASADSEARPDPR
ncbi:MAG: flippase-like domain-containing protein [Solirubrobacterales bacterium]|nr:flippase-like domain-containing protein [Solirubrobacterales bacterium]